MHLQLLLLTEALMHTDYCSLSTVVFFSVCRASAEPSFPASLLGSE